MRTHVEKKKDYESPKALVISTDLSSMVCTSEIGNAPIEGFIIDPTLDADWLI